MTPSESGSSSGWLREPEPGKFILIAKTGEGVSLPAYVEEVLKHFEEHIQAETPVVGEEAWCDEFLTCGEFEIM